jgi:hypothetical protein
MITMANSEHGSASARGNQGKRDVEVIEVGGAFLGHGTAASTRAQVNLGGMGNLGGALPIPTFSSLIIMLTPMGWDTKQMRVRAIMGCQRTLGNKWL